MEIGREDDAAGRERLQGKLPGQASPTLGQRDNDAIRPGRLDGATEVLGVLHHADDGVAELRSPLDLLDDLTAQRVPPEDQHALADVTKAPDAVTQAQSEQETDEDEEARHERIPVELRLRDEAVDDAHGFMRSRRGPRSGRIVPTPTRGAWRPGRTGSAPACRRRAARRDRARGDRR